MANSDSPSGFKPVRHMNGNPWNGATNTYYVPSTDGTVIGVGDPVKLAGSADANGVPTVTKASSGDRVIGIMTQIDLYPTNLTTKSRTASTGMYVKVCDDRDVIFEIQEDSDGAALAATSVGLNADWIDGGVSSSTGVSGVEIDSSSAATTNTLDLQVLRLVRREDNAIGTNAKWEVRLNKHQYTDQIAGI